MVVVVVVGVAGTIAKGNNNGTEKAIGQKMFHGYAGICMNILASPVLDIRKMNGQYEKEWVSEWLR